jgi:alkaline phosphatase
VRKYLVPFSVLIAVFVCTAAERRAKNVILFLGDAGGLPTLNATSLHKFGAPQKLFIQQMPHFALSDTSAADAWVTDSAAGMSAIVTGQKTNNGVISQSAAAVRGKQDGEILQTILEHAEQRGLSTGVMTNMVITDATAAACYAHVNDRRMAGEIFAQVLKPRFGDGVDVLIGAGRDTVRNATAKLGIDIDPALRARGYAVRESLDEIAPQDRRIVTLFNTSDFALWPAVEKALGILEKNPKGFFLMVEWDTHTDNLPRGLDQAAELDEVIRRTAAKMKGDTLILFAADHSFDLRLRGGKPGQPLVEGNTEPGGTPAKKPAIRVDNGHTGEEVVVAALGPGSERVHGFIPNTRLFEIMMAAYGWR